MEYIIEDKVIIYGYPSIKFSKLILIKISTETTFQYYRRPYVLQSKGVLIKVLTAYYNYFRL